MYITVQCILIIIIMMMVQSGNDVAIQAMMIFFPLFFFIILLSHNIRSRTTVVVYLMFVIVILFSSFLHSLAVSISIDFQEFIVFRKVTLPSKTLKAEGHVSQYEVMYYIINKRKKRNYKGNFRRRRGK